MHSKTIIALFRGLGLSKIWMGTFMSEIGTTHHPYGIVLSLYSKNQCGLAPMSLYVPVALLEFDIKNVLPIITVHNATFTFAKIN